MIIRAQSNEYEEHANWTFVWREGLVAVVVVGFFLFLSRFYSWLLEKCGRKPNSSTIMPMNYRESENGFCTRTIHLWVSHTGSWSRPASHNWCVLNRIVGMQNVSNWVFLLLSSSSVCFTGPRYRKPKVPKVKGESEEKRPRTAFSMDQLARLKVNIQFKPINLASFYSHINSLESASKLNAFQNQIDINNQVFVQFLSFLVIVI